MIQDVNDHSHIAKALLNSGAQENFIDRNFALQNRLQLTPLEGDPITIRYADGSTNPKATVRAKANLTTEIDDRTCEIQTLVTELHGKDIILGLPFLEKYNPDIDWNTRTLQWQNGPQEQLYIALMQTTNHPLTLNNLALDVLSNLDHISKETLKTDPYPTNDYLDLDFNEFSLSEELQLNYKTTTAGKLAADHSQQHQKAKPKLPLQFRRYSKIFDEKQSERYPPSRPYDHKIDFRKKENGTNDFTPISFKAYPLSPRELDATKEFIDENLRKGYIRKSESPMASPFFFVGKKDGKLRPCQDYRYLNKHTIRNAYPIPLITTIMDKLQNAKFFTKLDVRLGYNNVRIREGDEWKAAFKTPFGLFEPTVMFFGMTNSPATFQHMMDTILRPMLDKDEIIVYMDDILIFAEDQPELVRRTHQVLQTLLDNNLYLKLEKCEFNKQKLEYLGHIITPGRVEMDPTKLDGIRDWPLPRTTRDVRKFIGFTNYYRRFIHHYSDITKPLNSLLSKKTHFSWNDEANQAFERLKAEFLKQPVLITPDQSKPFEN